VDVESVISSGRNDRTILALSNALAEGTRETDIMGWYVENSMMGVIGTELGNATNQVIQDRFLSKLCKVFETSLGLEKSSSLSVSFHFFPKENLIDADDHSANIALYPEIQKRETRKGVPLAVKRCIDIVGSCMALVCGAPIYGERLP
jgi:hypothetical protein